MLGKHTFWGSADGHQRFPHTITAFRVSLALARPFGAPKHTAARHGNVQIGNTFQSPRFPQLRVPLRAELIHHFHPTNSFALTNVLPGAARCKG